MGMTMTQKILATHAGLDSVEAGQLIKAKLDMVLANDITGPVSIKEFDKAGFDKVFDKSKISLVITLYQTRTSRAPSSAKFAELLQSVLTLIISMTQEIWV